MCHINSQLLKWGVRPNSPNPPAYGPGVGGAVKPSGEEASLAPPFFCERGQVKELAVLSYTEMRIARMTRPR